MLRSLALMLVGAVHALAMTASVGNQWVGPLLQVIAMAALAGAVLQRSRTVNRSVISSGYDGLLFGIGWFAMGVGWVYISMHRYGGMHSVLAGLATLVFACYLALYPAAGCLVARLWQRNCPAVSPWSSLRFIVGFASAITLTELARGYFFTGFPWISPGYAHVDGPLAGLAPWGGVYAITWLSSACSSAIAWIALTAKPLTIRLALPSVLLIASFSMPSWLRSDPITQSQNPLAVTLLQGNINQAMKFDSNQVLSSIRVYLDLIEANQPPANADKAHLFVLPETAWPTALDNMPEDIKNRFDRITRNGQIKVAIGAPHWHNTLGSQNRGPAISNSVVVLGQNGMSRGGLDPTANENYRYDKTHLVPFGEFIPSGFQWFMNVLQMPLGSFKRGDAQQPSLNLQGQKIAFNICYEDLFGEELAIQAAQATVLINLSNLAWFDDSAALDQHLQIARMRVLETRKPMLRATNTGATAVIDADGSVRNVLPWLSRGQITTNIFGSVGSTFYMRWTNTPILLLCGLAAIILSILTYTRRQSFNAGRRG